MHDFGGIDRQRSALLAIPRGHERVAAFNRRDLRHPAIRFIAVQEHFVLLAAAHQRPGAARPRSRAGFPSASDRSGASGNSKPTAGLSRPVVVPSFPCSALRTQRLSESIVFRVLRKLSSRRRLLNQRVKGHRGYMLADNSPLAALARAASFLAGSYFVPGAFRCLRRSGIVGYR